MPTDGWIMGVGVLIFLFDNLLGELAHIRGRGLKVKKLSVRFQIELGDDSGWYSPCYSGGGCVPLE